MNGFPRGIAPITGASHGLTSVMRIVNPSHVADG